MVRLTVVPVMPAARSDAKNTAAFAISSSVMRRRGCVLLARNSCHCSQVMPDALARGSYASRIVRVCDMPCGRRPTTRFGAYLRTPTGIRHGVGLIVVTLAGDRIGAMTRFESNALTWFGLPHSLPGR